MLVSLLPDDASAQRGTRGGAGFSRGSAMGVGGFRAISPGGFRGVGMARPGGFAVRNARFGPGFRPVAARPWLAGRSDWGGRRGWRGGVPVAAGLGLGYGLYSSYPYDNDCVAWDGWRWVNVCYQPYPYRYW
jgi:hypothetical protein